MTWLHYYSHLGRISSKSLRGMSHIIKPLDGSCMGWCWVFSPLELFPVVLDGFGGKTIGCLRTYAYGILVCITHIYIYKLYIDINRWARVTQVLPRGTSCGEWQVAIDRRECLCLNLYLTSVKETPQNMSNIRTWRLQICLNTWLSTWKAKNPHEPTT